jgi:signal peptidase I
MAGGLLPLPGVGSRDPLPARRLPTAPGRRSGAAARVASGAAGALLGAGALLVALTVLGSISGRWGLEPVLTGSMRPGIQPGDLVLVTPEPVTAVRPGQILLFHPPGNGAPVVHRVVSVSTLDGVPAVHTRGDANNVADPWNARLDGSRAWRVRAVVPHLGYLAVAEHHPGLRLLLALGLVGSGLAVGLAVIWRRTEQEHETPPAWVPAC